MEHVESIIYLDFSFAFVATRHEILEEKLIFSDSLNRFYEVTLERAV